MSMTNQQARDEVEKGKKHVKKLQITQRKNASSAGKGNSLNSLLHKASCRCARSLWLPVLIDCDAFQDTACLHHTPALWRLQGLWTTAGSTIPKTDQLSRNFGQISVPYTRRLCRKQVSVEITLYLKGGMTLRTINMNICQLPHSSPSGLRHNYHTSSIKCVNSKNRSPRCRHKELLINVTILCTDDVNDMRVCLIQTLWLQLRNRWMLVTFYSSRAES